MNVAFLEAAQEELNEAVLYYEDQQEGLGEEFAAEAQKALDKIRQFPGAWTQLLPGVRRCRTNRFPYGLVFRVEGEDIYIVAVMHLHRDPDYWKHRLDQ